MRNIDPTDPNDSGEYDPSPRTPRPLPPAPVTTPTIESQLPKNEPASRFFKIAAAFVLIALGIIYIASR